MIGCLRTRIRKQPIIALYFESENELKFYNIEARAVIHKRLLRTANREYPDQTASSGSTLFVKAFTIGK